MSRVWLNERFCGRSRQFTVRIEAHFAHAARSYR